MNSSSGGVPKACVLTDLTKLELTVTCLERELVDSFDYRELSYTRKQLDPIVQFACLSYPIQSSLVDGTTANGVSFSILQHRAGSPCALMREYRVEPTIVLYENWDERE